MCIRKDKNKEDNNMDMMYKLVVFILFNICGCLWMYFAYKYNSEKAVFLTIADSVINDSDSDDGAQVKAVFTRDDMPGEFVSTKHTKEFHEKLVYNSNKMFKYLHARNISLVSMCALFFVFIMIVK